MVAEHGIGAPTTLVANKAVVAHGSVFNYFETKAELLNAVYLQLKGELDVAVLAGLPGDADPVAQLRHLWNRWMQWGTANPLRRRTLAQLAVSDQITEKTRARAKELAAAGVRIVQRVAAEGVFRDQPIEFIAGFFDALAGNTMDFMIADPVRAQVYRDTAFEALRRALS